MSKVTAPTKRQLEIEALVIQHSGKRSIVAKLLNLTLGSVNSSMQRLEAKRRRLARIAKNGR